MNPLLAAVMEVKYPGIAMNATILTFGTAASLLAAYKARIIKVRRDRWAWQEHTVALCPAMAMRQ